MSLWERYTRWKEENDIQASTPWEEAAYLARYIYSTEWDGVLVKRNPSVGDYDKIALEVLQIKGTPWDDTHEWHWLLRHIAVELLTLYNYRLANYNNTSIGRLAGEYRDMYEFERDRDETREYLKRVVEILEKGRDE